MAKAGKRTRMWLVGVAVLGVLVVSGGVAAARADHSDGDSARSVAKIGPAATPKTEKSRQPGRKPPPGPTPSPTTSSVGTPTPTATTTTSPSPGTGSDVKIPVAGFVPYFWSGDIVVDEARGRIYITGGKGTRDIVVTDLDGGVIRTIRDVAPGAAGMTLSPDGNKLYVAASDRDWLTIVDLDTYATTGQFAGKTDGTMTCPRDVAFAAGQLWVAWGCDNAPTGIGLVDLQTGGFYPNVTEGDGDIRSLLSSPALLATLPNEPNIVIAGATDSNPAGLYRFEATSTRLVLRATGTTDGGSVRQMAVTPDGSQIVIPSGAPYYHQVFRTSDLTLAGKYQTTTYPNAVAIRDDGLVVAGTDSSYDKDVWVFQPGGTTPIATFEFGHLPDQYTWAHTLVDGGLAVHGNRIYALTAQLSEPEMVTLRIRTVP